MRETYRYHPQHDTGPEPCQNGPCCEPQRETSRVEDLLKAWRRDVPEHVTSRLDQAGMTGNDTWPQAVDEIMFLMEQSDILTLGQFCRVVGVPRAKLMKWRRTHDHLEIACRDHMAAVVEDEMETSRRRMAPSVMTMALERVVPTFSRVADGSLSEEDAMVIVRTIVESVRTRVGALELPEAQMEAVIQGLSTDIIHAFTMR